MIDTRFNWITLVTPFSEYLMNEWSSFIWCAIRTAVSIIIIIIIMMLLSSRLFSVIDFTRFRFFIIVWFATCVSLAKGTSSNKVGHDLINVVVLSCYVAWVSNSNCIHCKNGKGGLIFTAVLKSFCLAFVKPTENSSQTWTWWND